MLQNLAEIKSSTHRCDLGLFQCKDMRDDFSTGISAGNKPQSLMFIFMPRVSENLLLKMRIAKYFGRKINQEAEIKRNQPIQVSAAHKGMSRSQAELLRQHPSRISKHSMRKPGRSSSCWTAPDTRQSENSKKVFINSFLLSESENLPSTCQKLV